MKLLLDKCLCVVLASSLSSVAFSDEASIPEGSSDKEFEKSRALCSATSRRIAQEASSLTNGYDYEIKVTLSAANVNCVTEISRDTTDIEKN